MHTGAPGVTSCGIYVIKVYGTGPRCTSLHRFRAATIFYPNFYPKGGAAGLKCRIPWSWPQTGVADQSSSPAFQAGHAGSIPVARSSLITFSDSYSRTSTIQFFCRAASLIMSYLSSLIAIFERSYVNLRGWWDYRSFYPECKQPEGWCCKLESAARSTVMSQDTGMVMTPIGNRGFTRRPSH